MSTICGDVYLKALMTFFFYFIINENFMYSVGICLLAYITYIFHRSLHHFFRRISRILWQLPDLIAHRFLPRCMDAMECQRGLATRKLSVRQSVSQMRGLWQNGRKFCPEFYTIRKIISVQFSDF